MRDDLRETRAPDQTLSVTADSDLYAKAERAGINVSQAAEQVVADAHSKKRREMIAAEIQQDPAAIDEYASRHGDFAELVRTHYEGDDGAV